MHPNVVELRQDRTLIRNNFDGYKLSLENIPVIKEDLDVKPLKIRPAEEQFSFLHVELFSLHNYLVKDHWNEGTSYFLDTNGNIYKNSYNQETGRPNSRTIVFGLASSVIADSEASGSYPPSFQFVSEKFCVFLNGKNHLYLFETGDRYKSVEWKLIFNTKIMDDMTGFVLSDARLDIIDEHKIISCAVRNIDNENKTFVTKLYACKFNEDVITKTWSFEIQEILTGKGSLNYCSVEPRTSALIVSSNHDFKFPLSCEDEKKDPPKEPQQNDFSWTQTDDDITIKLASRDSIDSQDYQVSCCEGTLQIKFKHETILDGKFFGKVDSDLTTWTLENNFLQVTLVKKTISLNWPYLFENGPKESTEDNNSAQMLVNGEPVANLESQTEDCDFPSATTDEEYFIERIDLSERKITHRIAIGSNPPLFSICLRPGFPNAIATRHDVDACLWLQHANLNSSNGSWSMRHEGSLPAIGYVQASKQQKKFICCSPDMTYTVICESIRHVFIYKSSYNAGNTLRNRNGPQISLGKQQLVTLEDTGEVLGISVDNFVTTLLTEKCLLYLKISD